MYGATDAFKKWSRAIDTMQIRQRYEYYNITNWKRATDALQVGTIQMWVELKSNWGGATAKWYLVKGEVILPK